MSQSHIIPWTALVSVFGKAMGIQSFGCYSDDLKSSFTRLCCVNATMVTIYATVTSYHQA